MQLVHELYVCRYGDAEDRRPIRRARSAAAHRGKPRGEAGSRGVPASDQLAQPSRIRLRRVRAADDILQSTIRARRSTHHPRHRHRNHAVTQNIGTSGTEPRVLGPSIHG